MKIFREFLIEQVKQYGEGIAIVSEQGDISWNRLLHDVCALGAVLGEGKSKKENRRIVVIGENCYPWILAHMCGVCGAGIVIPMDKDLAVETMCMQAALVEADTVFCTAQYLDKGEAVRRALVDAELYSMSEPDFNTLLARGYKRADQLGNIFLAEDIKLEDCATITFTSGTTAGAKGVMLSQENLAASALGAVWAAQYVPGDRLPLILPLYHIYACFVGLYSALLGGCTVCVCQDMKRFCDVIKKEHTNKMYLVPAFAEMMLQQIKSSGLSGDEFFGFHIDWIIVGGAKMPSYLIDEFRTIGIAIYEGYGITEASSFTHLNPIGSPKSGSVGKTPLGPYTLWEDKISEDGEVLIKGDTLMMGYYGNEENSIDEDGWLHTGDIGYLDEEGYLYISGRKKNVIILQNGKNVFPEELEAKIQTIEGVVEVLVYELDGRLTAEIFGAEANLETGIEALNKTLPPYQRVQKVLKRDTPFEKSSGQKIKRRHIAK